MGFFMQERSRRHVSPNLYATIGSATLAACQEIDLITNDRIQSTTAGWGALPVACYVVANVVGEFIRSESATNINYKQKSVRISSHDMRKMPLENVLRDAIEAALRMGVEKSDAALIAAVTFYFCGTNVRSGVAAGAKSLGRMARVISGAERGGAALLCAPWSTVRITAYPAVQAIYKAMNEGKLTRVKGTRLPLGVGGAPIVDDSVLGEDIIGPEVSANGAAVGTHAMLEAFAGAGMPQNKIISALLGTAAVLDIVHTDAMVGEEHGPYGSTSTIHVAGRSAARAAGLPEHFHVRGTKEKMESGRLLGELALILRECGNPSAIGMLALQEMLAIFEEGIANGAGFSAGPVAASLGFLNAYATLGLKYLQSFDWNLEKSADELQRLIKSSFIDSEYACLGYNTVARMAEGIYPGLASRLTLLVTEGAKILAINRRVRLAIDRIEQGVGIEQIAEEFDKARLACVEENCSRIFSESQGKSIQVKIHKLVRGARRKSALSKKFLSLDCNADVEVFVDGRPYLFSGLLHRSAPEIVLAQQDPQLPVLPFAAIPIDELILTPHTILNVTIPAVVGALLSEVEPQEAAEAAELGAWISSGTPGAKAKAVQAIYAARRYAQVMSSSEITIKNKKDAA